MSFSVSSFSFFFASSSPFSVFRSQLNNILDLFCPASCPVCGGALEDETEFGVLPPCRACAEKLSTPEGFYCLRCGGKRSVELAAVDRPCGRCRKKRFRFERAIVLGEYQTELRRLVLRMKTDRGGMLAAALATLLFRRRETALRAAEAEMIVPVPIHRRRRSRRGVNSPDFLAEELGRFLERPVMKHLVLRTRETEMQYLLSNTRRKSNVEGAFRLNQRSPDIAGRKILLVDDILTSGATCNEVSRVLLGAGARSVTVCVVARAEGFDEKYRVRRFEGEPKKRW